MIITREDLEQLAYYKKRIQLYERKKADLKSHAQGLTRQLNNYSSKSVRYDRLTEYMERLEELEDKYYYMVLECEQKEFDILSAINKLPSMYSEVITLRFINGFSWKKIETKMNYSIHHCQKILRDALSILNKDNAPSESDQERGGIA